MEGNGKMNSRENPWTSALKFFAELGDLLVKYAIQPGYAIPMVIVAWILWPLGALMASLLIASLYHRATQTSGSATLSGSTAQEAPAGAFLERGWVMLAGLALIAIGLLWLLRELFSPHLSFAFVLIALGVFLIFFNLARPGGR